MSITASEKNKGNNMADTRPTKINLVKIIYLCFLAVFYPKKFIKEEQNDNAIRKNFPPIQEEESKHGIYKITRAFWSALGLIILSAFFGGSAGLFLFRTFNQPDSIVITSFQIIGACLLLWGTLFIRGWEIQTYCGVTMTERVNQWIYRILYCLGTSIIICSLIWSLKSAI
jgi:hypothetical protein